MIRFYQYNRLSATVQEQPHESASNPGLFPPRTRRNGNLSPLLQKNSIQLHIFVLYYPKCLSPTGTFPRHSAAMTSVFSRGLAYRRTNRSGPAAGCCRHRPPPLSGRADPPPRPKFHPRLFRQRSPHTGCRTPPLPGETGPRRTTERIFGAVFCRAFLLCKNRMMYCFPPLSGHPKLPQNTSCAEAFTAPAQYCA